MADIKAIAKQFRDLPASVSATIHPLPEKAMTIQAEAAGRLLIEALDAGAFAWAKSLPRWREQSGGDYAMFWLSARQNWLAVARPTGRRFLGTDSPNWQYTFADDCRAIADLIEADLPEQTPAAAQPSVVSRTTWQHVQRELEAYVDNGGTLPNQTMLTKLCHCHHKVIKKAFAKSSKLRTARRNGGGRKSASVSVIAEDPMIIAESEEQSSDGDVSDIVERKESDEIFDEIMAAATPEQRTKYEAMSDEDRDKLIELAAESKRDRIASNKRQSWRRR